MCVSSSVSPSSSLDNRVRRSELYFDVVCVSKLLRYEDMVNMGEGRRRGWEMYENDPMLLTGGVCL